MKNFILIISLFAVSCGGTVVSNTTPDSDASANTQTAVSSVYLFASDYQSGGQLYTASLYSDGSTSLENSGLNLLGTEARIRYFNDTLYILHQGGSFNSVSTDNIQAVNPNNPNAPFSLLYQESLGNAVNPQDMLVYDGLIFVTLYNPGAQSSYVDSEGNPTDVLVLDETDFSVVAQFSFYNDLADDSNKSALPFKMLRVGTKLFVLLQDLDRPEFTVNTNGKLGVIDLESLTKLDTIQLEGQNPVDLVALPNSTHLLVASTGDLSLDSQEAGLEVVNYNTGTSSLMQSSLQLGGYITHLVQFGRDTFTVVNRYDDDFNFESQVLVLLDWEDNANFAFNTFGFDWQGDIRSIHRDGNYVWVSDRQNGSNRIQVYSWSQTNNAATLLGNGLSPVVPGVSFAGEL